MGKIFKQLARHWAACLAVVALLFVQAYCDLSLPDYTSKIVDTGIQQGGIESPLPETVRQSTLDALSLLMSEEDADALQNAYGYYLQDDGVLKLRSDLTDAERTALERPLPHRISCCIWRRRRMPTPLPGKTLPPWLRCPAIRARTRLPGLKQRP